MLPLSRMAYEPSWCRMVVMEHSRMETYSLEPEDRKRMFIFGMGFVGHCFAQQLKSQGWDVSGTCTSIMKKKQLADWGFDNGIYHFDANEPEWSILDVLNSHTHLLVSIPPFANIGDPLLQHEELLKKKLMDGNLQWLCYLSTTSIYGNCGGEWVDEDAVDTIIKQKDLSAGQRRRTRKLYTSRVHVEDICQALRAITLAYFPGKVLNIVDDDPAAREEVFAYAKYLIEKKWPGQIKWSAEQEEGLVTVKKESSFGEKRVSNARMKKELGVKLLYPSYRSGLQSIIDQMENPF
ncbi:uncharacterized protein LOC115723365 isoform X2 [Cannabis sativa]|uniref:uncharacterized protein LOC115723365 isoform X2 n=1 Tax=Cannabis sativa TaxID=3483 RepID=UPI0029C9E115|nr:uncharacterized protein LOC115723365 isoform X2 [Cannabis sativa]